MRAREPPDGGENKVQHPKPPPPKKKEASTERNFLPAEGMTTRATKMTNAPLRTRIVVIATSKDTLRACVSRRTRISSQRIGVSSPGG